jgi:hypothetical protein
MSFCPNCAAELLVSNEDCCPRCGALFGPGSSWKPVSAALGEPSKGEAKSAQGCFAAVLLLFGVGFLCLALAVRGATLAFVIMSVIGSLFVSFGVLAARAETSAGHKAAGVGGWLLIVLVLGAFALIVSQTGRR